MNWYARGFITTCLTVWANGLAAPKKASEYPGFNTWLTDNAIEVEPTPMEWENGGENIPAWLQGTYMKNGPARSKFGDDGPEYQNMVDGWAKINKFVIQDNGQLTYSSGFVNCPLYQDFVDHQRMTPHTILGKLMGDDFECPDLKTFAKGAQIENDNVTIEKMKVKGKTAMIASTDSATVNQFDKDNFAYRRTVQTAPLIAQDLVLMAQELLQQDGTSAMTAIEKEIIEDMLGINEQEFVNMLNDEINLDDVVNETVKGVSVHSSTMEDNEITERSLAGELSKSDAKNPVELVTMELCKTVNKAFSFIWEDILRRAFRLLWNEIQSRIPRGTFGSCAHWKKRPGQPDNFLNYGMSGLLLSPKLSLYQFTNGEVLDDSSGHRELLGEAMVPLKSLIHEFSVTPNYAIFFCYPVILDFSKVDLKSAALTMLNEDETWNELKTAARETIQPKFLIPFFEWGLDRLEPIVRAKIEKIQPSKRYPLQDLLSIMNTTAADTTHVVVFDLNERKEVMSATVDGFYGTHHVNAFEASDGTLVCDVVHAPNDALQHFTDKQFLRNHPVDETKFTTPFEIQRYTIDLVSNSIEKESWDEVFGIPAKNRRFVHQFDFPNVHPNRAGYEYRYAYGQSMIDFQRHYLIKKDLKRRDGHDMVWPNDDSDSSTNCQYSGEPFFIPTPEGSAEDDGVVLSVVLDGRRPNPNPEMIESPGESYLLVLNATTFEELDRAYLGCHIPLSIHGNWFNEIL
ncbi:unnamed protein product [Cylindrotheca closterium]|uniref:Uncharacterized protein n=1 Tax=Cylindrotheca closterium TaxID=2856 RepID=A0AAD2G3X1_9STRA|nr:unnamed protein product [Cylindrotheca closterium]